jgi:alpha-glucosidase (family GH31 glycosyl hydrolase)
LAWSPQGWGLYANSLGRVDHDIGLTDPDVYEVHLESAVLDLFLFVGEPAEILNQYTAITGRAGQPSLWSLGAWLKQPGQCTATQLMEQVERLRGLGVCLDTVMFNMPMAWRFNDAKLSIEWDANRFPDPKQVLDLFAAKAIQVCLPTLPAVEVGTSAFDELEDRGWLLINDSGHACVFKGNAATAGVDFALLDLTHRDVYQQWIERHRQLADEGVSAVMCDSQFDIPDDVTARGGESGSILRTLYPAIPYVLGAIEDSARTGLPVQRSMAMSFPGDTQAHAWDTQYLFGPAILVAPVTKAGRLTQVYLPAGDAWWDLNTGWRYEGGAVLEMDIGLDTLPVFGREGHMLCLGPQANHTGEFNSARILDEVWMFGMPIHNPVVMRNKIRVMQMQGSSYIKGLEGLKILPSEGLEVKRRGAEVRISRAR